MLRCEKPSSNSVNRVSGTGYGIFGFARQKIFGELIGGDDEVTRERWRKKESRWRERL